MRRTSVQRSLTIGLSLAPTWLSGEAWRRADSGIEGFYGTDFYVDVATRAEAAKLDFVFRPDTLFLDPSVLETGPGFGSLDPTLLMAAIARETRHIGLVTTISTMFLPPFMVARQLQSLHRISNGRAGWNIVTALGGQENFGLEEMPSSEARYARAAEFTELVQQLWASYPDDALVVDRSTGRYADPKRVQSLDHDGAQFRVKGPLNLPSHPAPLPLFQAGASEAGRDFAASVSNAIFASTPDRAAAVELRGDLRKRAVAVGRAADDIRLLPGLSLYLAPSRSEAEELFMATHARVDRRRRIAAIREMTGLDLTEWPDDRPVLAEDLPPPPTKVRSRTHTDLLTRLIERETPTPAELMTRPEVIGSAHWQVVGTPEDAASEIASWATAGAIDGFIAVPGGSTTSMHLTLEEVMPRLAEHGLFRSAYTDTDFSSRLTGLSSAQIPR